MSIQFYTIRLKKFYLLLIGFVPFWAGITVLFEEIGGNRPIAVLLGLGLLTVTAISAHLLARKKSILVIDNNIVSCDETSIPIDSILNIKIKKTGIGNTVVEFYLKPDIKHSFNLSNYKGNTNNVIAFLEHNLPNIERVKPIDLLD